MRKSLMCATAQTASSFMVILSTVSVGLSTALRAIVNSHQQEIVMNEDQVKGRLKEAKGKVKEIAGRVVGNKDLEQEGKIENAEGKVQTGYGDLKEDIKDAT
jgi:uncharacterized protein YjbJ (UPF0337 family)